MTIEPIQAMAAFLAANLVLTCLSVSWSVLGGLEHTAFLRAGYFPHWTSAINISRVAQPLPPDTARFCDSVIHAIPFHRGPLESSSLITRLLHVQPSQGRNPATTYLSPYPPAG